MLSLRRFAQPETDLSDSWSQMSETTEPWLLGAAVGVGVSGCHHASLNGARGFAKPAFDSVQRPLAAREKIAADLAYITNVPVPPVTLWDCAGTLFSISCRAFAQPLSLVDCLILINQQPSLLLSARQQVAAGLVFHTWIADTDHSMHPGNILIDADSAPNALNIAFIDHSYSLDFSLVPGPIVAPNPYYLKRSDVPNDDVAASAAAVLSVSQDQIAAVVKRVPSRYLKVSDGDAIILGLVTRQQHLKASLGVA